MSTDKQESIDVVELLYGIVKEEVDKLNEVSPQDPAVCEYSGLPAVEHYSSREITIDDIHKIAKEMFEEEEETDEEKAYRMGWLNGYDEGFRDGQYK